MKDGKIKLWSGIFSFILLVALIIRIQFLPGGIILPGWYLGLIIIGGIIIGCLIVSGLLRLVFKKISFPTLLAITSGICFIVFHFKLYSPTLKIIVPKGYVGQVALVLSNSRENILTIDTNGIGYLNKWTFEKTYLRPKVIDQEGNDLTENCVGFNPSTFWALGSTCCIDDKEIEYLCFEIVPPDKRGAKQYFDFDILDRVDRSLVGATK